MAIIESIRKVDNIEYKLKWFKSMEEIIEFNYNKLMEKLDKLPDAYVEMREYCNNQKQKYLL